MITGYSYFGIRNLDYAVLDYRRMKANGANAVLITFGENDVEYYLETMRELVTLAHDEGLLVYMNPWGVAKVFGGESDSALVTRHPDEMQIDLQGDRAPALCVNSPMFYDYILNWIDKAAYCGADILMWDEPHFFIYSWYRYFPERYGRLTCFCRHCHEKYFNRFQQPLPKQIDDQLMRFRHDSVVELLQKLARQTRNHGLKNSVCILPPLLDNRHGGIIDFEDVFRIPEMDIIATDPYWQVEDDEQVVREQYSQNAELLVKLAQQYQKEPEIWIKNYAITAGTEYFVRLATEISFTAGIRRILAWSYLGSAYMSYIRSANPAKVFLTQAEAFASCRQNAK